MSFKRHFVFVVFNDPVVVGVIDFLFSVLNKNKIRSKPHLTIQGPFEEKVSLETIASIKRRLADDDIFIGNPGLFETKDGVALFLKVRSQNLRKVWNKPDYPVELYGFNPHITLYEGADKERAAKACEFLKKNRVELICREFDVVQYVPKQMDMFPTGSVSGDENAISILMQRGKLSSTFRTRFMAALSSE